MVTEQILASIDNINEASERSTYCVLESMCKLIEKEIEFEEFCSSEIIQEGKVLDEVKKKGKKDKNKLITILAFLPRLIGEMCKAIKRFFVDSKVGETISNAAAEFEKMSDIEKKQAKVDEINEKSNSIFKLYVDKKGKVKVKKDKKAVLATLAWMGATAELMRKLFNGIKEEFDYAKPSKIRNFVDECEKIIHMQSDKKKSEVYDMGLDALGDLVKHLTKSSATLTSLCLGAKTVVETKKRELEASGEDVDGSTLSSISELLSKLTIINASIVAAGAALDKFRTIGDWLGFGVEGVENVIVDQKEGERKLFEDQIKSKVQQKRFPQHKGEPDEEYESRLAVMYYACSKEQMEKHPRQEGEKTSKYIERLAKAYYDEYGPDGITKALRRDFKINTKEATSNRKAADKAKRDQAKADYKARKAALRATPTIFDKDEQAAPPEAAPTPEATPDSGTKEV